MSFVAGAQRSGLVVRRSVRDVGELPRTVSDGTFRFPGLRLRLYCTVQQHSQNKLTSRRTACPRDFAEVERRWTRARRRKRKGHVFQK